MKTIALVAGLALLSSTSLASPQGQEPIGGTAQLNNITLPESAGNLHVVPVSRDDLASAFVIFVRQRVPPHFHESHTELLYVLQGEARMTLGDKHLTLKPGVFVEIPRGTVHAVDVTSDTPLKVLSVQTPRFDGKDRHFVSQPD
jgi:quercetin dioxygenase-like cupin family protein